MSKPRGEHWLKPIVISTITDYELASGFGAVFYIVNQTDTGTKNMDRDFEKEIGRGQMQ